jgi:hypothetical protein
MKATQEHSIFDKLGTPVDTRTHHHWKPTSTNSPKLKQHSSNGKRKATAKTFPTISQFHPCHPPAAGASLPSTSDPRLLFAGHMKVNCVMRLSILYKFSKEELQALLLNTKSLCTPVSHGCLVVSIIQFRSMDLLCNHASHIY